MDIDRNPADPAVAYDFAQLLLALQGPSPQQAVDALIDGGQGILLGSTYLADTPTAPRRYIGRTPLKTLVAVGGCTLATHAQATIDGYRGTTHDGAGNVVNAYFREQADALIGTVEAGGGWGTQRTLLLGHSLGGSIAEHVARYRNLQGRGDSVRVCTFGAPRPGSEVFASECAVTSRARWMTADDPVPLLPPGLRDELALIVGQSPTAILRFERFVHPVGGRSLYPDGSIRAEEQPTLAQLSPAGSLVGWLLAVDGSSVSGHHVSTYLARLALWRQQHPGTTGTVPPAAPAEAREERTTRLVTIAQREGAAAINAIQLRQNQSKPTLPAERIVRAIRAGGIWLVVWQNETITVTPHKKTAKGIAKVLNEFLIRLQRQALVRPEELVQQMQAYLAAAAAADGGFTPKLSTAIPEEA